MVLAPEGVVAGDHFLKQDRSQTGTGRVRRWWIADLVRGNFVSQLPDDKTESQDECDSANQIGHCRWVEAAVLLQSWSSRLQAEKRCSKPPESSLLEQRAGVVSPPAWGKRIFEGLLLGHSFARRTKM